MPPRLIVEDFVLKNGTFKLAAAVCTGRMTFPAFKFLLWEFFFLFWIFILHSSTHLALGRLKGVSVRKYHLREHKILHCTKKRCGVGGEKTSEALQKFFFVLCSTALKLFNSFESLKSVTCWQLFTWNVSFVWFETAEIIIPKWEDYNTERNISMYCTSSTSLLMTIVDQLMEYPAFYLYSPEEFTSTRVFFAKLN